MVKLTQMQAISLLQNAITLSEKIVGRDGSLNKFSGTSVIQRANLELSLFCSFLVGYPK